MDYSKVRGFNYQPSYGSTSFENWRHFDSNVVELELRRGKEHFPGMNTVRLWLDWDAYIREPKEILSRFDQALEITERLGLKAVPTLLNRWHNDFLDAGGIYLDHIMPKWSWLTKHDKDLFADYIENLVGSHASDERIMIWDLCNEPFSYSRPVDEMIEVERAEYEWLERIHKMVKRAGATAPVGVSIHPGHGKSGLERIEPLSDVLLIHPYFIADKGDEGKEKEYLQLLDDYVDVSHKSGKPLLTTEACWGSLDDEWRVKNIRFTLSSLKERGIGWIVHALHHSLVADLHRPEFGPVGEPGNLAFIEADGTLRSGHEVFNDY